MPRQSSLVRESIIAGALGAVAVAVWFLILDVINGRIFFTPAALGSAFFYQATGVDQVRINATTVIGYSVIHIVAFMIVGFLAARLMMGADREPRVLLGAGVAFMVMEIATLSFLMLLATWLLDALSIWTVLVANVLAAGVMGYYLYRQHPQVRQHLRTNLEERDLETTSASR